MKRVVINQSNYIPWKGYFDLAHDSDAFVFYDDVQFTKNDWRNRNRVKGATGASQWLSIPVGRDCHRLIRDVALADHTWQRRHWKTLSQLYASAPCFPHYRAFFEHVYLERQWERLSVLNQFLIRHIALEFLGIRTEFLDSSDIPASGAKQERVLNILIQLGASMYLSGPAGSRYLDAARFAERHIDLVWKDYSGYPEYPQGRPPFQHAVTILDLLFHVGTDAPYYIWGWRSDQPAREAGGRD